MKLVRAGFGNRVDNRTTGSSELGIIVGSLDRNLLYRVGIGDLEALTGYRYVVVLGAIDQEVVGASPRAVNGKRIVDRVLSATAGRDARKRQGKQGWIAALKREFRDLHLCDISAPHWCVDLQGYPYVFDYTNSNIDCPHLQRRVDDRRLIRADSNIRIFKRAEAFRGDSEFVSTKINRLKTVKALFGSQRLAVDIRVDARECYLCARNDQIVRVSYYACYGAAARLSRCNLAERPVRHGHCQQYNQNS